MVLVSAAAAAAVYAILRYTAPRWYGEQSAAAPASLRQSTDSWEEAVAKIKEERVESTTQPAIAVPPELRHYSDRGWFLATQVAEVRKYNIQTSQDFVDLAALIERGELVPLPALTDNYILYGVGGTANSDRFDRFADDHSVELYTESELRDTYSRLANTRANIESQSANLRAQLGALKKSDRAKQRDLQKQISAREQELKAVDDEKALLDQAYGTADSRQKLFMNYQSLQQLAKNFAGRSYNLDNPADRQAMKISLLRALRPQALKVLEEIAEKYHASFGRRLPVSSLVRPEQYQHALRKVNRNAVLIDTPPHSTGLAFDIDYRYMSSAEQSFLMIELARLEDVGRIEVLRERTANYHVFVFMNGMRPSDELIAASLDEAGAPAKEANHVDTKPARANNKSQKPKKTSARPRSRKRR
jgi:D-alanyl-D-alanine dipeptidase